VTPAQFAAPTCFIDVETFSDQPIELGPSKYVDSENFEILLLAWALNDEPVQVVDLTAGEQLPLRLVGLLTDPRVVKCAFNAAFELNCMGTVWPELVYPAQWACDLALARYHSIGMPLAGAAQVLGLGEQKDPVGKKLINLFCKPDGSGRRHLPRDFPEEWAKFKEYNAQDVRTERDLHSRLAWLQPPEAEHDLWLTDLRINKRGVRVDMDLVNRAIELDAANTARLLAQARELTGLENPNSPAQLKAWLGHEGSLDKAAVQELLARGDLPGLHRAVLSIRTELAKTSVKKYQAMAKSVCTDGRVHDLFNYYGAPRTGRWSGRNVQLQNLPRGSVKDLAAARRAVLTGGDLSALGSVPDVLSSLVRTALVPRQGAKFVVADFGQIEARVLAWLAGESATLDAFRNHVDVYCATASRMFGVEVTKTNENSHLRRKGKVAVLALGYQGGTGALRAMGGEGDDFELQRQVKLWRRANPHIVQMWDKVDQAARLVVRGGGRTCVRGLLRLEMAPEGHLLMALPSDRVLVYRDARLGRNRFGHEAVVFRGLDQKTRKWVELETFGGKMVENATQSIARDCLAWVLQRVEAVPGVRCVAHVHDEVVLEVDEDAQFGLAEALELMRVPPAWAPGLPLDADGFEDSYYRK
jgi:DNA polymerase